MTILWLSLENHKTTKRINSLGHTFIVYAWSEMCLMFLRSSNTLWYACPCRFKSIDGSSLSFPPAFHLCRGSFPTNRNGLETHVWENFGIKHANSLKTRSQSYSYDLESYWPFGMCHLRSDVKTRRVLLVLKELCFGASPLASGTERKWFILRHERIRADLVR